MVLCIGQHIGFHYPSGVLEIRGTKRQNYWGIAIAETFDTIVRYQNYDTFVQKYRIGIVSVSKFCTWKVSV